MNIGEFRYGDERQVATLLATPVPPSPDAELTAPTMVTSTMTVIALVEGAPPPASPLASASLRSTSLGRARDQ